MSFSTYTIAEYISSKDSIKAKILAIDVLIDSMFTAAAEAIGGAGAGVSQYSLDDGQVKINTTYRSVQEVQAGIQSLEALKQMYVSRLTGRVTVLRDEKSLRR